MPTLSQLPDNDRNYSTCETNKIK